MPRPGSSRARLREPARQGTHCTRPRYSQAPLCGADLARQPLQRLRPRSANLRESADSPPCAISALAQPTLQPASFCIRECARPVIRGRTRSRAKGTHVSPRAGRRWRGEACGDRLRRARLDARRHRARGRQAPQALPPLRMSRTRHRRRRKKNSCPSRRKNAPALSAAPR